MLDRLFRLSESGTSVRTEVLAGLTTFLTMAYIIFVQPSVLAFDFTGAPTGLDRDAVLLATCLSAALTSMAMGLYANYPIALAPGMGENFFLVSVIMSPALAATPAPWRTALGIVFISGVLFLVLSLLRVREMIINAVSPSMRSGIAVGIGLFITFIGLQNGGVIVDKPGTLVGLNTNLLKGDALAAITVFLVGTVVAAALQARRVRGAILWGIGAAAVAAAALGRVKLGGVFGLPHIAERAAFRMDLRSALNLACVPYIVVFLFMDMFDTVGTLMGVAQQAGLIHNNRLPRAERVLTVDAAGTVLGACLGTSTVTSYIESAAGVAYGGRTGLTSVVCGALFLLALFVSPLVAMIGQYPPITACALVIVGCMMMRNAALIEWDDHSEAIPAFLIAIGIPLSYSIADGLAIGFILYPIVKVLSGRWREVNPMMAMLSVVLLLYFALVRIRLS